MASAGVREGTINGLTGCVDPLIVMLSPSAADVAVILMGRRQLRDETAYVVRAGEKGGISCPVDISNPARLGSPAS